MKKSILLLLLGLAAAAPAFADAGRCLVFLTGPSVSKHFHPYDDRFNNSHMGLGIEAYYRKNRWLLGGSGHFMLNDSNDRSSYWIGVVPGYLVGGQDKLWGSLAVVAGGLKKAEYHHGRFSLFSLPCLALGYNRIALNIAYIPRIAGVTEPILLVQVKVLLYPFGRLS